MFNKFRKNTNEVTDADIEWYDAEGNKIEKKRDIVRDILIGYSVIISTAFLIFLATSSSDKPVVSAESETTTYVEETATTEPGSCESLEQPTVGQIVEEPTTQEVETTTEAISLYSEEDIELLALVMLAEAEGEDEYGRRLVVSTILNRVDSEKFPNTIYEVVYQEGQFSSMFNGRADRVVVTDEAREQVQKELESRSNYDVLYFRMYHYHSFGTPLFVHGCHYFSGK